MTNGNRQAEGLSRGPRVGKGRRLARLAPVWLVLGALPLAGCVTEVPAQQSAGAAPGYGYTCYAGVYVCRLPQQIASGTPCSCPGIGAPSFGTVH